MSFSIRLPPLPFNRGAQPPMKLIRIQSRCRRRDHWRKQAPRVAGMFRSEPIKPGGKEQAPSPAHNSSS